MINLLIGLIGTIRPLIRIKLNKLCLGQEITPSKYLVIVMMDFDHIYQNMYKHKNWSIQVGSIIVSD